jgi:hypothetical protein
VNTGLNSINGVKLLKMFYQEYDVMWLVRPYWLQAAAAQFGSKTFWLQ